MKLFKRKKNPGKDSMLYFLAVGTVWTGTFWKQKKIPFACQIGQNEHEQAYAVLLNYAYEMGYTPMEAILELADPISYEEYADMRMDLFVQLHSKMP